MFKRILASALIFIIVLGTFQMVPLFASDVNQSPQILSFRGQVYVHSAGGNNMTAVFSGMTINDGDVIITGTNSTATIGFYQQQVVVGELTKMSVNSVWQRHGRNNSAISLIEGQIKVRVDTRLDNNSRNMVMAAGTIVGVRGTEYILTYSRHGFHEDDFSYGRPFTRLLVIEGEVRLDMPGIDGAELETFRVTPQGLVRVTQSISGDQMTLDLENIPSAFIVPLESLDLAILELLLQDSRVQEENPELFQNIELAIERRIIENYVRNQLTPERPEPQPIFASQASEVLPTLETPTSRGEPAASTMPTNQEINQIANDVFIEIHGEDAAARLGITPTPDGERGVYDSDFISEIAQEIAGQRGTEATSPAINEPALNPPAVEGSTAAPITQPIAEPVIELPTEPITQPPTEPTIEQITEPVTQPITEPQTEPIVQPPTQPVTQPVTTPPTDPITQPPTAPNTTQPEIGGGGGTTQPPPQRQPQAVQEQEALLLPLQAVQTWFLLPLLQVWLS